MFLAHTKQVRESLSPISTVDFLLELASHKSNCWDWSIIPNTSPSVSHPNPAHKLETNTYDKKIRVGVETVKIKDKNHSENTSNSRRMLNLVFKNSIGLVPVEADLFDLVTVSVKDVDGRIDAGRGQIVARTLLPCYVDVAEAVRLFQTKQ